MRRASKSAAGIVAHLLLIWINTCTAEAEIQTWSIDHLDERVGSLQHPLNGRMPILAWNIPGVPRGDAAVQMRATGQLARNIAILWCKGIAPSVNLSAVVQRTGTLRGAIAVGATLQELGLPVHVFANPPEWIGNWTEMANGKMRHYPWDYWPDGDKQWFAFDVAFAGELWPVFPLADPEVGYAGFKQLLQGLQSGDSAAGLPGVATVSGLWMDYEDLPHPWNGALLSQRNGYIGYRTVASFYDDTTALFPGRGQSVRQVYGNDVLTNATVFMQYSMDLRQWLIEASARRAVTQVYGSEPLVGNYGAFFSSAQYPFYDENEAAYPIAQPPGAGLAAMPVLYANNKFLAKYLGGTGQPAANQLNADDVYWHLILRSFSSNARNAGAAGRSIPWVSQYVRDDTSGNFDLPMSVGLYQEALRHVWLRGASGMYVFNPYDSTVVAPDYKSGQYAIEQLEYVRAVLDEMLAFPEFLERGTPMNFDYAPMFDHGAFWSGLALNGDAIVRAISPNGAAETNIPLISVPGGATFVDVPAPGEGATYLLTSQGERHRIDLPHDGDSNDL